VHNAGIGYDAGFLDRTVALPTLGSSLRNKTVKTADGSDLLDYTHFSLVMHKERRMCVYTAVNIDGTSLKNIPRNDKWSLDTRIPANAQCDNKIYIDNKLDRGHMVRRLDAVWGSDSVARKANDDTFFYTNACPQHRDLNQKTWNDLEEYILGNAGAHRFRVTVFTGPVFGANDTAYRGIRIPQEFWKVVAWMKDDQLRATAYLLSQRSMMTDLEAFDFGKYRTYQLAIAEVQGKTGLTFGDLPDHDVLGSRPQGEGLRSTAKELEGLRDMVL
jgi:endonuclease G